MQSRWSPRIENWTAFQVKKNLWKFDSIETFDDVMQDSRILFFKLEKKYPSHIITEDAHFVALYKTSLLRLFIDKARRKQRTITVDPNLSAEDASANLHLEGTPNYGYIGLLLAELPSELKVVLKVLTSGRVRLKLDRPARKGVKRENHNMRLKRRLSLSTSDPVGDLKAYFNS